MSEHKKAKRKELKRLMVELGEQNPSYASRLVNRLDDDAVEILLAKKRAKRALQLEVEAIAKKNNAEEPEQSSLVEEPSKSVFEHTTGGGKRIIRKGSEMS